MARAVYCRHALCGHVEEVIAGLLPPICPGCNKISKWSTTPGNIVKPRAKNPRVQFDLNLNDRRLLKSLRIATDTNNDADDDGA